MPRTGLEPPAAPCRRVIGALFAACALCWFTPSVSLAAAARTTGPHAWLVVPDDGGGARHALMHAPPRGIDAGEHEPGTVRLAAWLARPPTHVAAWGSRVWVALERERLGESGSHQRRVLTAREERAGGSWRLRPADRMNVLPSLPGEEDLAGFIGTVIGPAALLHAAAADPAWQLLVYDGQTWRSVGLPWKESPAAAWLIAHPAGLALVCAGVAGTGDAPAERATMWTLDLAEMSVGELADAEAEWADTDIGWKATWPPARRPRRADEAALQLFGVDGQVVASEWSRRRGVVPSLLRASGVYDLPDVPGVPAAHWVSPISPGSLVVLWDPESGPPGQRSADAENPGKLRIAELSVSGAVLYSGPARSGGPVSRRDVQALVAILVGVMAAIVLFVLRSDQGRVPPLPAGVVSAGLGRRIIAAGFDFAPALLAASAVSGVRPSEVLAPTEWFASGIAFKPLLTALLLAWGHSTMGDWLFGGSIGKMMTGCSVLSMRSRRVPSTEPVSTPPPDAEAPDEALRPTLVQAGVRNAVRWFLPVLGVVMLFDALRRHPGDLIAGTVVVCPEEEALDLEG